MAFSINDFQSRLRYGGARPSLFEVTLNANDTSVFNDNKDDFRFKCRATQMPEATVSQIEIPYFGRTIKVRGNRTFGDWPVTIIQDEDFELRDKFEYWQNSINSFVRNQGDSFGEAFENPENYKGTGNITRFRKDGAEARTYEINGIWPMQIGAVSLDWGNNDIENFDVTFAIDWWTPPLGSGGTSGLGSGVGTTLPPGFTFF